MTANEYVALGETTERYELVEGVVVMSPSAVRDYGELVIEIGTHLTLASFSGIAAAQR